MIRRFVLAVAATAAVCVPSTNAAAQSSSDSRIHALRSDSDNDVDMTSEYTMWYWVRFLSGLGPGPYATFAHGSRAAAEPTSLPGNALDLAWARFTQPRAAASTNTADDPGLPENVEFFNPPALTDEHADAPPGVGTSLPSLFTSVQDESSPPATAAALSFVSTSLPGADAWTSVDAESTNESSGVTPDRSDDALAPIVEAPTLAVVASPEPGTLTLFATGCVGIVAIAIKRKRAVA